MGMGGRSQQARRDKETREEWERMERLEKRQGRRKRRGNFEEIMGRMIVAAGCLVVARENLDVALAYIPPASNYALPGLGEIPLLIKHLENDLICLMHVLETRNPKNRKGGRNG